MTNIVKVVSGVLVLSACTTDGRTSTSAAQQAVTAAPSTVMHAVQQGRDANVGGYDGYGWYGVDTFETGTGANTDAFLDYWYIVPDPASATVYDIELGFGAIPSADLSIAADVSSAALHTTTGAGFTVQQCTDDISPGGLFTCTDATGSPRTFDLVWTYNRMASFAFDGTSRFSGGGLTYITTGSNEGKSADVNGTASGHPLSSPYGSISDSHNTQISHDLTRTTP